MLQDVWAEWPYPNPGSVEVEPRYLLEQAARLTSARNEIYRSAGFLEDGTGAETIDAQCALDAIDDQFDTIDVSIAAAVSAAIEVGAPAPGSGDDRELNYMRGYMQAHQDMRGEKA